MKVFCAVVLLAVLAACGRHAPTAPTDSLEISGYVYQGMTRGAGEPPIAGVLITVKAEDGVQVTTSSDDRGFYMVKAPSGPVLVTATKPGYSTVESRFEADDSTVLNFSLVPTAR